MSPPRTAALQSLYDRFFSEFLLPLVRGGSIRIGAPIAPGVLPTFFGAVPSQGADAADLLVARQAIAADVLADPLVARLTEDDVRVGAALHNILYRTHPDASDLRATRARRRAAEWARRFLEEAREPEGRDELLERHTLVAPFFRTSRVDTVLYTLAYRYRFYGREPSALYSPTLGRFRTEKTDTAFNDLRFDDDGNALLERLMERSPLTALLTPTRALPPFAWTHDMVVGLRDEAVCRAVGYAHADLGLLRLAGPLGVAFDRAVEDDTLGGPDLFFVACFYYNLLLTLALQSPQRLARDIEAAARATPVRTLFAVQLAVLQHLHETHAPALPLSDADRSLVVVALGNAVASAPQLLERTDRLIAKLAGAPLPAAPLTGYTP